jgi:hypothetical protein
MRNKLFYFYWSNPFKTLWKAHYVFKMPKLRIVFFNARRNEYCAKILDVIGMDVDWKTKYNEVRFEYSPKISIVLFRRLGMQITMNYPFDCEHCVWETILDYLYMNKTLEQSIKDNTWTNLYTQKEYNAKDFIKWC